MQRPSRSGQSMQALVLHHGNSLRDGVIVIAAHRHRRVFTNPIHTRHRIGRIIDQIAYDADGRRHRSSAPTRQETRPERMPLDGNGIEHAPHVGKRRVARDERGVHAQVERPRGKLTADGEVLDDVAKALGKPVIDGLNLADPAQLHGG